MCSMNPDQISGSLPNGSTGSPALVTLLRTGRGNTEANLPSKALTAPLALRGPDPPYPIVFAGLAQILEKHIRTKGPGDLQHSDYGLDGSEPASSS